MDGEMLGKIIDQFQVPVCDKFLPRLFRNQLCYAINVSDLVTKKNHELNSGLVFLMDYNQGRSAPGSISESESTILNFADATFTPPKEEEAKIYLETIGL